MPAFASLSTASGHSGSSSGVNASARWKNCAADEIALSRTARSPAS